MAIRLGLIRRHKDKKAQERADAQEIINRVRTMYTSQGLCNLVSELAAPGVGKRMAPDSGGRCLQSLDVGFPPGPLEGFLGGSRSFFLRP